ncbi:MAG: hypothetical protein IPO21_10535 [Bacteroidales bacterium]|nr:hypothetical protein [Bacteroidales bacterium]
MHKFDSLNQTIEVYSYPAISSNFVLYIEPNGDGKLWLATWGGGICLFDPKTGTSRTFIPNDERKDWINFNCVKGVLKDGDYLWVATHGNGINIYDIKKDCFYNAQNPSPLFPFNMSIPFWSNNIIKDSRGNYWMTTSFGLFMFDGRSLFSYFNNKQDTTSISGSFISMVFEDKDSAIWVCTEGLDKFDYKTQTFKHLSSQFELMPRSLKAIAQDKNGRYWVSSNKGLVCIEPKTGYFKHYLVEDGLQGNAFNNKSTLTTKAKSHLYQLASRNIHLPCNCSK